MSNRGKRGNNYQPWKTAGGERSDRSRTAVPATGQPQSGRGGASAPERMGNVREMVERMSSQARSQSPSKRRRETPPRDVPQNDALPSDSEELDVTSTRPVTEGMLNSAMDRIVRRIRYDLALEFTALKTQIAQLGTRVHDLEKHVEQRDNVIDELSERLVERDEQVRQLEAELDAVGVEQRRRDLLFSGMAVPRRPAQQWWEEDVKAVTIDMLSKFLPDIPVVPDDIESCERVDRMILCRFRSAGRGATRERVYEHRFRSKKFPMPGEEGKNIELFINENLTSRQQGVVKTLLAAKRAKRIYSVFTKHGDIFYKPEQHATKIRVTGLQHAQLIARGS